MTLKTTSSSPGTGIPVTLSTVSTFDGSPNDEKTVFCHVTEAIVIIWSLERRASIGKMEALLEVFERRPEKPEVRRHEKFLSPL